MEEAVLARYGLLGLAVLIFITYAPRLLDKMTTWAMRHAENEDRAEERLQATLADELKGGRLEREAYRQEREQYLQEIKTLGAKIALLDQRISEAIILIRDFDDRMRLHMQRLSK